MLLHLTGKVKNSQVLFELPDLNFSTKQSVEVKQILIEWGTRVSFIHGSICSSLIDSSVNNPDQCLCIFSQASSSNHLLFTPPSGLWYQIQLWSLRQAIFKIELSEKHEIKKIKIILDIRDGLQQNS